MGADSGAHMNELDAVAAGRWSEFHGLAACAVGTADEQLGPPLEREARGGMFGGEPAQFRRYPPAPGAPMGITCWTQGELVIGLQISEPAPEAAALAVLGPPEVSMTSDLGASWSQEVWASRGLVVHRRDDRYQVAFALAPFDPQEWESDPLRWWRIERFRR